MNLEMEYVVVVVDVDFSSSFSSFCSFCSLFLFFVGVSVDEEEFCSETLSVSSS